MRLKKIVFGALLVFVLSLSALPVSAANQCIPKPSEGAFFKDLTDGCISCGDCKTCDIIQLFINVANIILGFTGAAALLMFIIGGIMMITSYGHEEWVKNGKNTIIAAMSGIIVIMISWIVMNALIMGITNNKFNIENLLTKQLPACKTQAEIEFNSAELPSNLDYTDTEITPPPHPDDQ